METGLAVISLRHVSVFIPYKSKFLSYTYRGRFGKISRMLLKTKLFTKTERESSYMLFIS